MVYHHCISLMLRSVTGTQDNSSVLKLEQLIALNWWSCFIGLVQVELWVGSKLPDGADITTNYLWKICHFLLKYSIELSSYTYFLTLAWKLRWSLSTWLTCLIRSILENVPQAKTLPHVGDTNKIDAHMHGGKLIHENCATNPCQTLLAEMCYISK